MLIVVFIGVAALVVGGFVTYVKLDDKASTTDRNAAAALATVKQIRNAQVTNTKHSNEIATCELNGYNAAFLALQIGFMGDKNPAHYPKFIPCSALNLKPPTVPTTTTTVPGGSNAG